MPGALVPASAASASAFSQNLSVAWWASKAPSGCWKRAKKRAWKTPGREIALRRLARAEELGISYREYTLEIMERGVYL